MEMTPMRGDNGWKFQCLTMERERIPSTRHEREREKKNQLQVDLSISF